MINREFNAQKNTLQGVLQAHDSVAAKDFTPHLPEIPIEVDEDEETVKIVQLVKSNEPMVRDQDPAQSCAVNVIDYLTTRTSRLRTGQNSYYFLLKKKKLEFCS